MKILVFGKTGQVATELARAAEVVALGRDVAPLDQAGAAARAIEDHAPDAIINAAAYTAVDRAEEEFGLACRVNGDAPGEMARAAAARGVPLVHISTDYVFGGTGTAPWSPAHPVSPVNAYGRSKLAGEEAVRAAGGPHAILRTAWVFSAHGQNFVKTMLALSQTRDALQIVDDQFGGPTPADAIAAACLTIATALAEDPGLGGTYHFSGTPETSWKGFAEAIFDKAGRRVAVSGIATANYPRPAPRPLNSRLDCSATEAAFGLARPDWRNGLDRVLAALGATD